MSRPRQTIVRGARIRIRLPGGGRSYKPIGGLLQYIAYGRYVDRLVADRLRQSSQQQPPPQRGIWIDQVGKPHEHAAVVQWAQTKVNRLGYDVGYQLLLSTRHGGLTEKDFNRALQAGSAISDVQEWRLMTHDDSAHQHAHVVLFRRSALPVADYKRWQQTMQQALDRLQIERAKTQELALTSGQAQTAEPELTREALELSL